jgi:transcription elongation factor Elf1
VQEDDSAEKRRALGAGPFTCPKCGRFAVPASVATHGPGKVLIHLRCDSCGYEYDCERKTQTLFDPPA